MGSKMIISCVLMLLALLAMRTDGKQTPGEYWGEKVIQEMTAHGQDGEPIAFLKDLKLIRNILISYHGHRAGKHPPMGLPNSTSSRKQDNISIRLEKFPNYMHLFFHPEDMMPGKVISLYFRGPFKSHLPHFLPKKTADLIPFTLRDYPTILVRLGLRIGSPLAQAVHTTLRDCGEEPAEGMTNFCTTSYEGMMEKLQKISGSTRTNNMKPYSTSKLPNSTQLLQSYTVISKAKEIQGSHNFIACHMLAYPYAVFLCHRTRGVSNAFEMRLKDADGSHVDAIAACHFSTSDWSPQVPAFAYLGSKPGDPICHVLPHGSLLWVPTSGQH